MNKHWKGVTLAATATAVMLLGACSKASDTTAGGASTPAAATTSAAAGSSTSAGSSAGTSSADTTSAGSSSDTRSSSAGGTVEGCTPTTKTNPQIAIISKGFQHQFWQAVRLGAENKAKELGATITFDGPATEADIQPQLDQLKAALATKPDAIGFAALDSKAAEPILQQAKAAGIPVIAFDSGVDSDIPLTTAATDNVAAAGEAAKHMAELIGNSGTVGLVVHDQTSTTGQQRRDGFIDWMKENAPNIKVLEPQYGAGDAAKSADITKQIIAGNPDIKGIYGANEGSAIGVIQGVKESGKKDIKVIGFDSGSKQIDAITSGAEAGAVTQNPVGIGEQTVDAAMKALKCEALPTRIDTGYYWFDKSNIDAPEIKAVLYK
ncbi:MAG: ABC transporter substrate-binding protein [Nakamurella sp.]